MARRCGGRFLNTVMRSPNTTSSVVSNGAPGAVRRAVASSNDITGSATCGPPRP
jgi:hypothetical protein